MERVAEHINWSVIVSQSVRRFTQQRKGVDFSEVVCQSRSVGGSRRGGKYIRARARETTHHLLSLWSRSKEQIQQLLMHAFCPSER